MSPRNFTHALLGLAAIVACSYFPGRAYAGAAPACVPAECYTAEQVRTDLNTLYATMRASHFNLYARVPQAPYDSHLADLLAEVDGPMAKAEAHLLMQRLLAFGRVAHARTEAPLQDALAYAQAGGKILPINVRILDGRMMLDEWADPSGQLQPGSEILSINGIAVTDLYRKLRTIVSADTDALLQAQIEQALPIYLYLLFGAQDRAEVEAVSPDGRRSSFEVTAVDMTTMRAFDAADPVAEPVLETGKREFRILGDGIAYLRPGPFGNVAGESASGSQSYDPRPFEKFLAAAFDTFRNSRASDLIIDLRGNSGGDNSFSDLMIARIADKPFRFASRFRVKASAATKAQYAKEVFEPETLMAMMVAAEMGAANGSIYDVEMPLVQPRANGRFDGKVWVLIDRHSYSNAAVVAGMIQDYRFGTLMGEATADLATTYGSVEHFQLPHSGISIAYPKSYMVRPSGDRRVRGVQPDIPLAAQPINDAKDRVLEAAVTYVTRHR